MLKRLVVLMCVVTVMLAGAFVMTAEVDAAQQLWGSQTAGTGAMNNASFNGNKLTLSSAARVVKVGGNAASFCIYNVASSTRVLCQAQGQSIVGQSLSAGTYQVLPDLGYGQKKSEVTITLQ